MFHTVKWDLLSVQHINARGPRGRKCTIKRMVSYRSAKFHANDRTDYTKLPVSNQCYKTIPHMPIFDTYQQAAEYKALLLGKESPFLMRGHSAVVGELLAKVGLDPNYDPSYANRMMMEADNV